VHRQVSEPPLEPRAPLVRQLLQVAEPAPRLVPLNLLLELRVQLVLLIDRTPLCSEACWPFTGAEKLILDKPRRRDQTPAVLFQVAGVGVSSHQLAAEGWVPSF